MLFFGCQEMSRMIDSYGFGLFLNGHKVWLIQLYVFLLHLFFPHGHAMPSEGVSFWLCKCVVEIQFLISFRKRLK